MFEELLKRARAAAKQESDPERAGWWRGYVRGLRRGHHRENFGTAAEHETWLSYADSDNASRAALGAGYRAGLTLRWRTPEDGAAGDTVIARWRARMAQQRGGTYTQRDAASDLGMALSSYQDQERGTNRVTGEPIRTPRSLLRACAAIEHGIDPIE